MEASLLKCPAPTLTRRTSAKILSAEIPKDPWNDEVNCLCKMISENMVGHPPNGSRAF
jgi:hypothetical protein